MSDKLGIALQERCFIEVRLYCKNAVERLLLRYTPPPGYGKYKNAEIQRPSPNIPHTVILKDIIGSVVGQGV